MSAFFDDFIRQLQHDCVKRYVRIPVFIQGDENFALSVLKTLPDAIVISDTFMYPKRHLWRETPTLLGQQTASLLLDLRDEMKQSSSACLDKLCALAGCIEGGHHTHTHTLQNSNRKHTSVSCLWCLCLLVKISPQTGFEVCKKHSAVINILVFLHKKKGEDWRHFHSFSLIEKFWSISGRPEAQSVITAGARRPSERAVAFKMANIGDSASD